MDEPDVIPTPLADESPERRRRRFVANRAFGAIKAQHAAHRTPLQIAADTLNDVASSTPFLFLHVIWFAAWILVNTGALGFEPFDPYPFGFLTLVVSLEAIFLSIFVLMSQKRESAIAELREELSLQVSLRMEEEVTKTLQLVSGLYTRLGHVMGEDGAYAILDGLDDWLEQSLVSRGAANSAKILARTKQLLGEERYNQLAASGSRPEVTTLFATTSQEKSMIKVTRRMFVKMGGAVVALPLVAGEEVEPRRRAEGQRAVGGRERRVDLPAGRVDVDGGTARVHARHRDVAVDDARKLDDLRPGAGLWVFPQGERRPPAERPTIARDGRMLALARPIPIGDGRALLARSASLAENQYMTRLKRTAIPANRMIPFEPPKSPPSSPDQKV